MQKNNKCLDWNPCEHFEGVAPKVLLIGHDPRLQTSDTIADYALFKPILMLFMSEVLDAKAHSALFLRACI